jgi:hypothetical protein
MSISTGTILKVVATLLWTDGNVAQNVFNALITGGGGPWDEDDVVDDALTWLDAMYDTIAGWVSDEMTGSQVQVYEWDAGGEDWDEVGSAVWVYAGSSINDQLPRGVAALLNAKTTDPDVSGKKYLPGATEGNVGDGLWEEAFLSALVDFGGEWVPGFTGSATAADWDPGVWSVVGSALLPMNLTVVIPTIPAYQRRRKRGVGI